MAGYPITPASEILENSVDIMPEYGGVVVQAEDELSSVNRSKLLGLPRNDSNCRSWIIFNARSFGLAGAVELPLVIVDTQKSGPTSGLATK